LLARPVAPARRWLACMCTHTHAPTRRVFASVRHAAHHAAGERASVCLCVQARAKACGCARADARALVCWDKLPDVPAAHADTPALRGAQCTHARTRRSNAAAHMHIYLEHMHTHTHTYILRYKGDACRFNAGEV